MKPKNQYLLVFSRFLEIRRLYLSLFSDLGFNVNICTDEADFIDGASEKTDFVVLDLQDSDWDISRFKAEIGKVAQAPAAVFVSREKASGNSIINAQIMYSTKLRGNYILTDRSSIFSAAPAEVLDVIARLQSHLERT